MRLNPGAFTLYGADIHGPYISADGVVFWAAICSTSKADFAARVFRQVGDGPATEVPHGLPYTPLHVTLSLTGGTLFATFLSNDRVPRADAVLVPGFKVAPPQPAPLPTGMVSVPLADMQQIASIAMRNIH